MMKRLILIFLILFIACSQQWQFIQESNTTSVTVINAGVAGNNTRDLLKRVQKDVIDQNPDLVVMMIGTNDFCNDRKFISIRKYESNLNRLILSISQRSKLILLTIPPVQWKKLFERHDRNKYPKNYLNLINRCNEIIKSKDCYGIVYIIDLHHYFNCLGQNWLLDGVHQNDEANRAMAAIIYQYILDNFDISEIKKIICFGDSITESRKLKVRYTDYLEWLLNKNDKLD